MARHIDSWRSGGTGRGPYVLRPRTTGEVPLTLKGITGAADSDILFRILKSDDTSVFSVTSAGSLSFAGSGTVTIDETITGNLTVSGSATLNGNTTLGNASTDTLSVVATASFSNPITGSVTFSSLITGNNGLTVNGTTNLNGVVNFNGGSSFTGVSSFADGTAAAPSITFTSDTDTGFYRAAANQIGFAVAGAVELTLDGTNLSPGANDGNALGVSGTAWADLFLASGAVVNFNAGNYTITHAASALTLAPVIATTGSPTSLTLTQPAHTGLTLSAENTSVNFNLSATKQFATGAIVTQREVRFQAPTYGFVGASTVTLSATVSVDGAPLQGTNATLTTNAALMINTWSASGDGDDIGVLVLMPGIAVNSGAKTGLFGIQVDNPAGVVLGNETSTLDDLASVELTAISYSSTTLTRTITSPSTLYIEGAPINGGNITFSNGPYSIFVDAGLSRFDDQISFGAGTAVTAGLYSVGRDADGTNQLHENVPTGATFEWSVNDVAQLTLSATTLGLATNTITGVGSAITGTALTALTISVADSTGTNNGTDITLQAGAASTSGTGGDIILRPGAAAGANGPGTVLFKEGSAGNTVGEIYSTGANIFSIGAMASGDSVRFELNGMAGAPSFNVLMLTSAVNYLQVVGAVASSEPILSAQGTDTDIDITMTPKGAGDVAISAGGLRISAGRIQGLQGADVASGTSLTLLEGNVFEVTGTTQIDQILTTGWQEGSVVTLVFNESVTVRHGIATSGANVTILLSAAGNLSATANDTLTLALCSTTANGQAWREIARTVI